MTLAIYPWQADWYRQRVRENLGAGTDDHFRLWMTDRALHGGVEDPTRVVDYILTLGGSEDVQWRMRSNWQCTCRLLNARRAGIASGP